MENRRPLPGDVELVLRDLQARTRALPPAWSLIVGVLSQKSFPDSVKPNPLNRCSGEVGARSSHPSQARSSLRSASFASGGIRSATIAYERFSVPPRQSSTAPRAASPRGLWPLLFSGFPPDSPGAVVPRHHKNCEPSHSPEVRSGEVLDLTSGGIVGETASFSR
jgi:hypothetical protein